MTSTAAAPAPVNNDPVAWHAYIRQAPTFSHAQDRIAEAVCAGVSFEALNALARA